MFKFQLVGNARSHVSGSGQKFDALASSLDLFQESQASFERDWLRTLSSGIAQCLPTVCALYPDRSTHSSDWIDKEAYTLHIVQTQSVLVLSVFRRDSHLKSMTFNLPIFFRFSFRSLLVGTKKMQCFHSDLSHKIVSFIFQPFELLGVGYDHVCFHESVHWKVEAFPHFLQSSDNFSHKPFSYQFFWNG